MIRNQSGINETLSKLLKDCWMKSFERRSPIMTAEAISKGIIWKTNLRGRGTTAETPAKRTHSRHRPWGIPDGYPHPPYISSSVHTYLLGHVLPAPSARRFRYAAIVPETRRTRRADGPRET